MAVVWDCTRASSESIVPILSKVSDVMTWKHFRFLGPSTGYRVFQEQRISNVYAFNIYRKVSNIRRTKSQNLNASRLTL